MNGFDLDSLPSVEAGEVIADTVCPSLTYKQRLWGFAICFSVGLIISLGSMMFFRKLLLVLLHARLTLENDSSLGV